MSRSRGALLAVLSAVGLSLILALPASAYQRPHHPAPHRPSHVRPHQSVNSSYPDYLVAHRGFVYFEADAPTGGNALWRSDGTPSGLTDIYDNVDPEQLTWAGNQLFFVGYDPTFGDELWVSDGTHLGTHIVKDSVVGGDAYIRYITAVGNRVFYSEDDGTHGMEPWVSDGTPGGTHIAKDIIPGLGESDPYGFTALGNVAIFEATDVSHGTELWRSDGSPSGTKMVRDIDSGIFSSYPTSFIPIGSKLLFSAYDGTHGTEPWITDGTKNGTQMLKNIGVGDHNGLWPNSYTGLFTRFGDKVFFEADDGTHNFELWKTDGTKAGTKLAVDIWPGPRSGDPWTMISNGQALVLSAANSTHGYGIWRSGGTAATTDVPQGSGTDVAVLEHVPEPRSGRARRVEGRLRVGRRDARVGTVGVRCDQGWNTHPAGHRSRRRRVRSEQFRERPDGRRGTRLLRRLQPDLWERIVGHGRDARRHARD